MRTDEEIIARIDEVEGRDWLGTEISDLLRRLPFEKAKPFLSEEVKESEWECLPRDRESVIKEIAGYMEFAWDKANGCRGISAGRSLSHFSAWVWLAGDDLGDLTDYEFYGKDHLCRICEHYGIDHKQYDDGVRTN